jgi:hypothetical protein
MFRLENECEFVLWVKIDGKVFNLEQPVIFGTIYIPPEYTRYSSDEASCTVKFTTILKNMGY